MAKERTGIAPLVKHDKQYQGDIESLVSESMTTPFMEELGEGYSPDRLSSTILLTTEEVTNQADYGVKQATLNLGDIKDHQQKRFKTILKSVNVNVDIFGINADPQIQRHMVQATQVNVALIKNMTRDYGAKAYDDIQAIIQNNQFDLQAQQEQIHQYLDPKGKGGRFVKNRARLIARDQNNKLVGELNQISHQSAGGAEYRWSTARDNRVRSRHASRQGKIFRWDDPPEDGHPGQAIQCRCTAKFIFREKGEKNTATTFAPFKQTEDGRPVYLFEGVQYTPERTAKGHTVNMVVDAAQLNRNWKRNTSNYIGAKDEGIVSAGLNASGEVVRDVDGKVVKASRKHWFKEWRKENPTTPVEQPWISVNDKGLVDFINGRHRTSVLIHDEKKTSLVVSVSADRVEQAIKHLGAVELGNKKLTLLELEGVD